MTDADKEELGYLRAALPRHIPLILAFHTLVTLVEDARPVYVWQYLSWLKCNSPRIYRMFIKEFEHDQH